MTAEGPDSHTRITGLARLFSRTIWLLIVGLLTVAFSIGVPVRFRILSIPAAEQDSLLISNLPPGLELLASSFLGPNEIKALDTLGLSTQAFAGLVLLPEVILAIACLTVGGLIYWRKSDDWMALWFSLITVALGFSSVSLVLPTLSLVWHGWGLLSTFAGFMGMVSNVHILFLSPDGRFVPRWTLFPTAGFTGMMLAAGLYIASDYTASGYSINLQFILAAAPIWFALIGIGIVSQIYRYRRVSSAAQRQQTKWVIIGLIVVAIGFVINASFLFLSVKHSGLLRIQNNLARAWLANLCMLFLPVCLLFSIFRYRLWDIDLIIRRTLIYGVLSAILGGVYFGSIVAMQGLFAILGSQRSPLVTVLSTLGIAALFNPLRRRVQDFIDRRFFRRRYDAERALASFAATARDEVDMDRLEGAMIKVVLGTIQPKSVSLWLKKITFQRPREAQTVLRASGDES